MVVVKPGQLVRSTAGRDIGAYYVVIDATDQMFVRVADGVRRTVAKCKKKNIRHLWVHDAVHHELASALEKRGKVTDQQVRTALQELQGEKEEVG